MIRTSIYTARFFPVLVGLFSVSLFAGVMGCGGGASAPTPPPTGITIQGPTSGNVDPGDAASFTAAVQNDSKNAGVTWALSGTGCTGAACGALSSSTTTGVTYTAPATVATAFTVTITATSVTNTSATATATLSVPVNPAITTPVGALAGGNVGVAYSVTLAEVGGISPYTWVVTKGTLPAGLALDASTGVVAGMPTAMGTSTFTVTLTDSGSPALTATATFSITVASPALMITTTMLANGTVGTEYSVTLGASGGSGMGYTWMVTSGTGLSAVGLSLSTSGVVTGIPTAGETAAPFTVQVKDSVGNTAMATLELNVTSQAFQGQVVSGQLGVSGATIQIYTVGGTGNGSAATPMLTQTVTTDTAGFFAIAGDYTCGQSSTGSAVSSSSNQAYLVATGGTTDANSGSNNSGLVMVAALGTCSTISSAPYIYVNELTTAAAAWALAPFTTSAANIGASSTNVSGIQNAFLDAALLANTATGFAATLPTNLTIETGKLDALADVLASCVNSSDGSACGPLFTAATPGGGTTPTDTFAAALNIVKNPGQNVAAVYATIGSSTPPYTTTLTEAPNDWTMSLTVTGGALSVPTALGIDSVSNVWVANQDGPLSAFGPQGTPLSSTGFGVGSLAQNYGLAIDTIGNVWITNYNGGYGGQGSVTAFVGANSSAGPLGYLPVTSGFSDGICYPTAIAADTNGDMIIANQECSSVTVYNSSAVAIDTNLGANFNLGAIPSFVAIDSSHGVWLSDNDNTIAHIGAPSVAYPSGQLLSHPDCCYTSTGLATDAQGNVWVANHGGTSNDGSFSEVGSDGTVLINQAVGGGVTFPYAVAVDAGQNVWFTNIDNRSISEIAGSGGTIPAGTPLSPTTGVYGSGGYGLDATLSNPYAVAPDRSGNIWVSNDGENDIVMFFGLATPTVTPLQPVPTAP